MQEPEVPGPHLLLSIMGWRGEGRGNEQRYRQIKMNQDTGSCEIMYCPSGICMCQWALSSSDQAMAWCLTGTKPLPDLMMTWCQLNPQQHTFILFHSKCKCFVSRNCILRNYVCVVYLKWPYRFWPGCANWRIQMEQNWSTGWCQNHLTTCKKWDSTLYFYPYQSQYCI